MLGGEADCSGGSIHAAVDVPDVEVLRRVHHEELAQAVHETGRAPGVLFALPVVVDSAPIYLHDWQLACIAPDGDGRGVGVVVDATNGWKRQYTGREPESVNTYAIDPHEKPTSR